MTCKISTLLIFKNNKNVSLACAKHMPWWEARSLSVNDLYPKYPSISKIYHQYTYNLHCWEASLGHHEALTLPLVTLGYSKISKKYQQYTQILASTMQQEASLVCKEAPDLCQSTTFWQGIFQNNPKHIIGMTK